MKMSEHVLSPCVISPTTGKSTVKWFERPSRKFSGFGATRRLPALALAAAAVVPFGIGAAQAAVIIKSDTTTMNFATDWNGTAPDITTLGEFSGIPTSTTNANMTLGGDVSLLGLQFDNNLSGPVTISCKRGL